MLRRILLATLSLLVVGGLVGAVFLVWGYRYVTRDLPDFHSVEDYRPPAVSTVLANDGTTVAEFFQERRYPVRISDVPEHVRDAFLAAEDASFYSHKGIDPVSILRAAIKNFQAGASRQGGSTITQQVVKNMMLSNEKSLLRKAKEAILSYRLENRLTKDEILELYLNQIFFGNNSYGLLSASRTYFHKELSEISLAEGALLASLPKAPSRFSPLSNMPRAKERQRYVLNQMVKAGFVTQKEADEAFKQKIQVFPSSSQNFFRAPYYVSEVRRILGERFRNLNPDVDGLTIHTALDLDADEVATRSLRAGLREVDKRRGWRGPLATESSKTAFIKRFNGIAVKDLREGELYPALVTERLNRESFRVTLGGFDAVLSVAKAGWAKKRIDREDRSSFGSLEQWLRVGDVVEVSVAPEVVEKGKKAPSRSVPMADRLQIDQTPDIEGAVVLLDPHTGHVAAAVGGYSYQRSVFNRATQSYRQPGSSFKPVVYLAAVDGFQYTPSTIVHDQPRTFKVGDELWTPGNFDDSFMGGIPLSLALERSRNLVSAEIVSRIGIDAVISYARRLGIQTRLGRNLSLSLGSSEVTLLELVRSYGPFAAKGVLFPDIFITKIEDRFGKVIYDADAEALSLASQAISPTSAFIMAHMMEGVVQRGTGVRIKELGRPTAGKTGTSNDQMDTWFIGYTPSWVCGVWVGFDQKKTIGDKETGGRVAAPIFLYTMRDFLTKQDAKTYTSLVAEAKSESERLGIEYLPPEPLQPDQFSVPDGVEPFWVNKDTGVLAEAGAPGAVIQYFLKGTEPPRGEAVEDTSAYLDSPEL